MRKLYGDFKEMLKDRASDHFPNDRKMPGWIDTDLHLCPIFERWLNEKFAIILRVSQAIRGMRNLTIVMSIRFGSTRQIGKLHMTSGWTKERTIISSLSKLITDFLISQYHILNLRSWMERDCVATDSFMTESTLPDLEPV